MTCSGTCMFHPVMNSVICGILKEVCNESKVVCVCASSVSE